MNLKYMKNFLAMTVTVLIFSPLLLSALYLHVPSSVVLGAGPVFGPPAPGNPSPQGGNDGGNQGGNNGGNQGGNSGSITINNPLKNGTDTLPKFLQLVLKDVVIPVAAVVAVLAIIYAGFLFVMARGNDKKLQDAKNAFFTAVVGTAIVLGAWVIAQAIQTTINQIVN